MAVLRGLCGLCGKNAVGRSLSFEHDVSDELERGKLARVLERYCEPFAGYYLYYPQRRHASRALRALIDHLGGWRQAGSGRKRTR